MSPDTSFRKTKVLPLYSCLFQMAYAQERRVYWSGDPGKEESEEDVLMLESEEGVLMMPESEGDVLMMPQTERRVVRWTESAGDAVPELEVRLTPPGFIDSHSVLTSDAIVEASAARARNSSRCSRLPDRGTSRRAQQAEHQQLPPDKQQQTPGSRGRNSTRRVAFGEMGLVDVLNTRCAQGGGC